jgi:hypothetical protein
MLPEDGIGDAETCGSKITNGIKTLKKIDAIVGLS